MSPKKVFFLASGKTEIGVFSNFKTAQVAAKQVCEQGCSKKFAAEMRITPHRLDSVRESFIPTAFALIVAVILCLFAPAAHAQTDQAAMARQAAAVVPQIQKQLLDPDSFRFLGADLRSRKEHGHPVSYVCISYSAHNQMGGFSDAMTAVFGDGRVIDIGHDYTSGPYQLCSPLTHWGGKRKDLIDITADVQAALAERTK
jgi:hypothetical protein